MVWSEYIGQSITVPSDKNPANATDKRDWVFIGGDLPAEFVNTSYNAALIFYNGRYVGAGSEVKFLAFVPLGSNLGVSSVRIVAYVTFDGAGGQFVTYASFVAADSSRSNAGGVSLENPRALEIQETRPDSLVRYDSLPTQWTVPNNNTSYLFPLPTNGVWTNLPQMSGIAIDIPFGFYLEAELSGLLHTVNNGATLGFANVRLNLNGVTQDGASVGGLTEMYASVKLSGTVTGPVTQCDISAQGQFQSGTNADFRSAATGGARLRYRLVRYSS